MIEISTLHCWEVYIFAVREVVAKINRLYNRWEKYVQEKVRHKEMEGYLCKGHQLCSIWWHKGAFLGASPMT